MSARLFNYARDEPSTPLTPFKLARLVDAAIQRLMDEGALPRQGFTLADLHGTYDDLRDCEENVALGLPGSSAEAVFHQRIAAECKRRCEGLRAGMEEIREEMGRVRDRTPEEERRVMAEVIHREVEERIERAVVTEEEIEEAMERLERSWNSSRFPQIEDSEMEDSEAEDSEEEDSEVEDSEMEESAQPGQEVEGPPEEEEPEDMYMRLMRPQPTRAEMEGWLETGRARIAGMERDIQQLVPEEEYRRVMEQVARATEEGMRATEDGMRATEEGRSSTRALPQEGEEARRPSMVEMESEYETQWERVKHLMGAMEEVMGARERRIMEEAEREGEAEREEARREATAYREVMNETRAVMLREAVAYELLGGMEVDEQEEQAAMDLLRFQARLNILHGVPR